jgi:hypothetical protein
MSYNRKNVSFLIAALEVIEVRRQWQYAYEGIVNETMDYSL